MGRITEEVFTVMKAVGYETHWRKPAKFRDPFCDRLVPDTAEHESAMLQDIAAGKRTEIDALNGVVIALAQEYGVAGPYNLAVCNLIKFLETAHTG